MNTKRMPETDFERMIFTLPKSLSGEIETYARLLRNGNKSGFITDAIRSYIAYFRKRRHTDLLRQGYKAASDRGRTTNREWEPLDDETWAILEKLEKQTQTKS